MMDLHDIELPTLREDSLEMRPWRADDALAVAAMCDDPSVARYIPLPSPYALADGEEWIGDAARKWREDHWAQFAVTRCESAELVASCGVKIDAERHSGEIGQLVKKEARRTGVASGAVRLLVAWCFDELGLGRLQIRADPANTASRRTDDVMYNLLPSDPRAGT